MTQDVVIVGGGAMGSSTAWNLARRGLDVTLLERFSPGHTFGASHGAARNFNVAYSDPTYIALLHESLRGWRELEDASSTQLLDLVGLVNHGPDPAHRPTHEALRAAGIASELLSAGAAQERWAGIRFETEVLYMPEAGRVRADAAVAALQKAAMHHGATVHYDTRVTAIEPAGDLVHISTEGETYTSRIVVVTAGAWTEKLLGTRLPLPKLVVTQEQPAHFRPLDDTTAWPSFNHFPSDDYWLSPVYGMLTPREGVKAGWHGVGPVMDPDARTFQPVQDQLEALQRYAREWLPGVDADDVAPISCTYTSTPDTNFLLDRRGQIVVGAGFSGHGFKFTPAVGRVLADLATGEREAPSLFRLR